MTIDTLAYTKRLEAAGVDRKVAEAQAEGMLRDIFPQIATKTDLDLAVSGLHKAISEAKLWTIGSQVGMVVLALTIAKALF
jgi:hypothetical protein